MDDLENLKRYVEIADMVDLRAMATEFAVEHDFDCLGIVTGEIRKRIELDKVAKLKWLRKKENEGSEDMPSTATRKPIATSKKD